MLGTLDLNWLEVYGEPARFLTDRTRNVRCLCGFIDSCNLALYIFLSFLCLLTENVTIGVVGEAPFTRIERVDGAVEAVVEHFYGIYLRTHFTVINQTPETHIIVLLYIYVVNGQRSTI